jgi:hypothetical protein
MSATSADVGAPMLQSEAVGQFPPRLLVQWSSGAKVSSVPPWPSLVALGAMPASWPLSA